MSILPEGLALPTIAFCVVGFCVGIWVGLKGYRWRRAYRSVAFFTALVLLCLSGLTFVVINSRQLISFPQDRNEPTFLLPWTPCGGTNFLPGGVHRQQANAQTIRREVIDNPDCLPDVLVAKSTLFLVCSIFFGSLAYILIVLFRGAARFKVFNKLLDYLKTLLPTFCRSDK